MKWLSVCSLVFLIAASSPGQRQTGISPEVLRELQQSCPSDGYFRAAQNALTQVDVRKVSLNWQKLTGLDEHFSNTLPKEKITDQKSSGRCWMFSALNIFRRTAAKELDCEDIEFSQNYLFFFDKLEKSNVFLEAIIRSKDKPYTDRLVEWLMRNPVQDGGNWLGFIELVKKYGVVPKDVMPETFSSSNSDGVNRVLGLRLKKAALAIREAHSDGEIERLKLQALNDVYRILALNFGIPPAQFQWRYESKDKNLSHATTYTPRQFYHDVVRDVLDDYLALYSIPTLPFGKKFSIELDKAVEDRPDMFFVNCDLESLKHLAKIVLVDAQPVWFGCDVGQEVSTENGLMVPGINDYASLYGMDLSLSRKELFETYSSIPNHNMVLTGVDVVDDRPVKWLVENSWGDKSGKQGMLVMADAWFDRYVQVIVVQRKYLPADILSVFSTEATPLPPWDPMMKALGYE